MTKLKRHKHPQLCQFKASEYLTSQTDGPQGGTESQSTLAATHCRKTYFKSKQPLLCLVQCSQNSHRKTISWHPSIKVWKLSLPFFLHAYCTHHVSRKWLFFQINLELLKGSRSQFTISMRQAQHSQGNYKLHLTILPAHFNLGWKAISAERRKKDGAGPMLALQGMGESV